MQFYTGLLIGLEIQISQLLFHCASSGFPNAAVYAIWHVSSSRCSSGVLPLHLSRRAVWVVGHCFYEGAMQNAAFVRCKFQRCGQAPGMFRVHCTAFDLRRSGFYECLRWLAILQNILEMKNKSHLQVTRKMSIKQFLRLRLIVWQ